MRVKKMSRFLFVIMISLLIVLNIYLITAEEFGYDYKGTSGSSTVIIISNGTDTNETTRFNVLVGTDCSAGDFVIGIQTNGALLCATPLSVGDNASWNQSGYYSNATASFALIGASEVDPYWTGNKSAYANYSNLTLFFLKISDWNATNTSYYLITNPYGYYNVSNFNISAYLNSTYTLGNITSANTSLYNWIVAQGYTAGGITWANIVNGTMMSQATFNTNYSANDASYRSITNTSYVDYNNVSNLNVNGSNYWDSYDTANTTQFENSGGKLQLIMSWFIDAFNSVFSSKTTNDLTQGSTNLYDNKSWNQSLYYSNATASFALIGASEVDPYWTGNKSAYANYSNLTLFFLKISDWNATNASYYLITNPYGFFNSTSNIGNWSADKSNYSNYSNNTLTFSTISEPLWTDNFTKYNTTWSAGITWANAINGTLVDWTYALNGTLFRLSDWQTNYTANDQIYRSFSLNYSDYLTIKEYALNDSKWTSNYSAFLNKRDLTNNTFTGQSNFTGNINMTNQNITQISYSTFCNGADCWRMYVNSSDWFIIEGI